MTLALNREVDPHCEHCKWRHVCHGGCMQRAIKFYGTVNTRDYYCPSLYRIYEHIEARLREHPTLPLQRLPATYAQDVRPAPPERELSLRQIKHRVRHRKTDQQN